MNIECEKIEFNSWHAHLEHKPIGSINRLWKLVYMTSANERCI